MNPAVSAPGPQLPTPSPLAVQLGSSPNPPALGSKVGQQSPGSGCGEVVRRPNWGSRNNSWPLAAVLGERSGFFPTPPAPGAASDRQTRLESETALSCPSVDVGAYSYPVRTYPRMPVPLHLRLSSPCASTLRPGHVYTSVPSFLSGGPRQSWTPYWSVSFCHSVAFSV